MTEHTALKTDVVTVVTFSIGNQRLAVPATDLREILDPLPKTRVPGAGSFAPWVLNVRGAVLPLTDLRIPLNISAQATDDAPEDAQRFMVLEVDIGGEPAAVAIMADCVHEVTSIPQGSIDPLPKISTWPAEYVSGIFKEAEDDFVLMPNLSAIFTAMALRAECA